MTRLNVETTLFGPGDQDEAPATTLLKNKPALTLAPDPRTELDKFHDKLFAAFDKQNESLWNHGTVFWPEVRMERFADYLGRDTLEVHVTLGRFTFKADFYQSRNPYENAVQASLGGRAGKDFVSLPLAGDKEASFLRNQNVAALSMNFKNGEMRFLRPDRTDAGFDFAQAQTLLKGVAKEKKEALAQEEAERPAREAMEERWNNFYGNGVMGLGAYGIRFNPAIKTYEPVEDFRPFLRPRRDNGNGTSGKASRHNPGSMTPGNG